MAVVTVSISANCESRPSVNSITKKSKDQTGDTGSLDTTCAHELALDTCMATRISDSVSLRVLALCVFESHCAGDVNS